MKRRQGAGCYHHATIHGTRKSHDGILDLASLAHIDRDDLHPQSRRCGLHGGELTDPSSYSGVPKNCGSCNAGCDLLEQFQKFSAYVVFEQHKTGGIAARPRQIVNKTGADWIGDDRKYDGYRPGRLQQRSHCRASCGLNDVWREGNQFRHIFANAIGISRAPTYVESDVAAVRPTQLLKRLQESCVAGLDVRVVSGAAVEHADASYASILLCGRRGRPSHRSSRRAAEKPNEIAPSHMPPRGLTTGSYQPSRVVRIGWSDVRFRS